MERIVGKNLSCKYSFPHISIQSAHTTATLGHNFESQGFNFLQH